MTRPRRLGAWAQSRNVFGVVMGIAFVLPILWLIMTAITPPKDLGKLPPEYVPTSPTLVNFKQAFLQYGFGHFLVNSAIVCVATSCAVVALGTFAGYSLARTHMRGKTTLLLSLLVVAVFPEISVVVPLYMILRILGWLNSYEALIVPYTAFNLPFAIWVLRNTFASLPREMEEVAEVDGASPLATVLRVMVPQALPGMFVAGILTFVSCWTEFLMALTFNSNASFQTAPVGIALFGADFQMPFGTIFAASFVALIPIFLIALGFRRWIVSGLSAGAVKG